MQDHIPSCYPLKAYKTNCGKLQEDPKVDELSAQESASDDQLAEKMGISVGKLQSMKAYAAQLVRDNPGIKPKKVASKVAIKYNVKLV